MKKGYIGHYQNDQLIQEEFNDFEISENSNWQILPWTQNMDTQIYNCSMANSPGENYSFNKVICKWVNNN